MRSRARLDRYRAFARRRLEQTEESRTGGCSIQRPTLTPGPQGPTQALAVVASGLPCGLQSMGGVESVEAGSEQVALARYWLNLPFGQQVNINDRVVLTGSGRTFEVLGTYGVSDDITATVAVREVEAA